MGFSTREEEQRLGAVGAPSSTEGNHHAAAVAWNGPTAERTTTARDSGTTRRRHTEVKEHRVPAEARFPALRGSGTADRRAGER